MTRKILVAALAISMLFNLAVLIGFARSRAAASTAEPREPSTPAATSPASGPFLRRMAKELHLDAQQTGALQQLQQRQQQQNSVFTDSLTVVRQDLAEELRKQQPDLERVRTLVDQEAEVVRQRRMAEADLYGEFVGLLSPEQKRALGERLQPRSRPHAALPPEVVRRFDVNRNGRLEPEEMHVARRDVDARRRALLPHQPQRPAIWPWFDRDDDGELKDAERAEMETFMREHRPPPPREMRP